MKRCAISIAWIGCLGLGMLLVTAGCEPIFAPIQDLPDELTTVVEAKATFAQDEADPLTAVAGGTIVDDLDGLTGCWGTFATIEIEADPPQVEDESVAALLPDSYPFDDYEVFVFDTETGEMKWLILTEDGWGLTTMVQVYSGDFTTADGNRLSFTTDEVGFNDPETGRIEMAEAVEDYEWLVTLSEDRLKLTFVPNDDQGDDVFRDDLVFKRFECPQVE